MDKDGVRRTRQGDIAGSLLYLAPEQFKGWDADRRTDIFSYSDVYYELLAGEHPFYAEDPGTVVYRITAHDPQPIRQILPECPAALEAMIQRLMSKDRDQTSWKRSYSIRSPSCNGCGRTGRRPWSPQSPR